MTHANDPKAAPAVPVPSTPETRRVRVIPGLRTSVLASVHADTIFTPITDWMPAALFGIASEEPVTITDESPPSSTNG